MKRNCFLLFIIVAVLFSACSPAGSTARKSNPDETARQAIEGFLDSLVSKKYLTAASYTWEESLVAAGMDIYARREQLKKMTQNNPVTKYEIVKQEEISNDMVLFTVNLQYKNSSPKTEEILMVKKARLWHNSIDKYIKREVYKQNAQKVPGQINFTNINVYYYHDSIKIKAPVTNDTDRDISLGWDEKSTVTLTTDKGTYTSQFDKKVTLKSGGSDTFTMPFKGAQGKPISFEIDKIFDLDENLKPIEGAQSYTIKGIIE